MLLTRLRWPFFIKVSAVTASALPGTTNTDIDLRMLLPVTAGLLAAELAAAIPDTAAITAAASLALLVAGMPHGGFDLALIRAAGRSNDAVSRAVIIVLYIGCAALTYAVWMLAPLAALAGFLVLAVIHFSEDWRSCGPGVLAAGLAAAIVAAPAVLHGDMLGRLFVDLAGDPDAALLADGLLLLAPTAFVLAGVALAGLLQTGQRRLAAAALCSLAAMLLLPPVIGFAVHFCLVHSPLQFRSHARALRIPRFAQWRGTVIPLSLGGFAVAGLILLLNGPMPLLHNLYASSFMALAVLVVPHMAVPLAISRLQSHQTRALRNAMGAGFISTRRGCFTFPNPAVFSPPWWQ